MSKDEVTRKEMLEPKPHKWTERYEQHSADFYPFVDGIPRPDLADCDRCIYGPTIHDGYCDKGREIDGVKDAKLYLFCGPICGYFKIEEKP